MKLSQQRNITWYFSFVPAAVITAFCLLFSAFSIHAADTNGISYNPENCLKPPFIALDYLTASPTANGNRLTWATIVEFGNSGFNLYRQEKNAAGELVNKIQVNQDLIPAQPEAKWGATYTFEDTTVAVGKTYYYTIEDIDSNGDNTLQEDFITEAKPNETHPVACLLYGIQEQPFNNSILFSYNLNDNTVKQIGELCKGCDIEAMAIHPVTNEIYVGSGDHAFGHPKGHLYRLDPTTGNLHSIGNTGFKDLSGLSFDNHGTLWAWVKDQGLVTLDTNTAQSQLQLSSTAKLKDLTWDTTSQVLYGLIGKQLWSYAPANGKVTTVCSGLSPKTDAVKVLPSSVLPEGLVLLGLYNNKKLELQAYEIATCKPRKEFNFAIGYDDVEGLAMPMGACGQ